MTKVTMTRHRWNGWYTLEVKGHATGSKALCAAVSCLVQTLEGWLKTRRRLLAGRCEIKSGEAMIRFHEAYPGECGGVWELLTAGFLRLAVTEPKRITVEIKNDPEWEDESEQERWMSLENDRRILSWLAGEKRPRKKFQWKSKITPERG